MARTVWCVPLHGASLTPHRADPSLRLHGCVSPCLSHLCAAKRLLLSMICLRAPDSSSVSRLCSFPTRCGWKRLKLWKLFTSMHRPPMLLRTVELGQAATTRHVACMAGPCAALAATLIDSSGYVKSSLMSVCVTGAQREMLYLHYRLAASQLFCPESFSSSLRSWPLCKRQVKLGSEHLLLWLLMLLGGTSNSRWAHLKVTFQPATAEFHRLTP